MSASQQILDALAANGFSELSQTEQKVNGRKFRFNVFTNGRRNFTLQRVYDSKGNVEMVDLSVQVSTTNLIADDIAAIKQIAAASSAEAST